jgi:hypothetical protein
MQLIIMIILSLFLSLIALRSFEQTSLVQETVSYLRETMELAYCADALMAYAVALYRERSDLRTYITEHTKYVITKLPLLEKSDPKLERLKYTLTFTQKSAESVMLNLELESTHTCRCSACWMLSIYEHEGRIVLYRV